jgi:hypothetical protein
MLNMESIGEPQLLQNSAKGAGQNAITVDIPNGPTRAGMYWSVDSAALYYFSNTDAGLTLLPCGIYIVAIGSPAVTDGVGILDVVNRGVGIALAASGAAPDFSSLTALPEVVAETRVARVNSIVPYGYTLRGVWANDPGTPANFPRGTLALAAIVRRIICN